MSIRLGVIFGYLGLPEKLGVRVFRSSHKVVESMNPYWDVCVCLEPGLLSS